MSVNLLLVCLGVLLWSSIGITHKSKTDSTSIIYQWNLLEFEFPSMKDRRVAIVNGNLVEGNAIPIDVQPHITSDGKHRTFVTIPRFQSGIPYTLATVGNRSRGSSPSLNPYPNYGWHKSHGTNCDGITSAFRVAITPCNQMWVIDSGMIEGVQRCAPQLLLFDLESDTLVHRFRFNGTLYVPMASLFITPVASVRDPPPGLCQSTMVYVADVTYHGLVVYDYKENTAWRVENRFMYPDPSYGIHTIAGESFTLMDGLFGLSTDEENLYFHPLASRSEYKVPLSVLDQKDNWADNVMAQPDEFRHLGKRNSECAAEAMDSRGNIYCVTFQPIRLITWNVNTHYKEKNFREISVNEMFLEFVSGMKVAKNVDGQEELWMLSNRFQKIAAATQVPTETNFRILKILISEEQNSSGGDLHNKLIFS